MSYDGGDGIAIRRVETQAEYEECVQLQDETWGAGFSERVPAAILKVAQYIGGVTAAAFDGPGKNAHVLGFVFGMTGVRDRELVHWSDMLAVRPEARNHGIGRKLKLYQRSLVAELGVTQMLWTYDPLVSRNAHLNLNCLGARVTDYVRDMYGSDTGSALHQGIGTDRFVVAWDLTGEDEEKRSDGDGRQLEIEVEIPDDIQEIIAAAPAQAQAWRDATRAAFLRHLPNGYRVSGYYRKDGSGFYRLTREAD